MNWPIIDCQYIYLAVNKLKDAHTRYVSLDGAEKDTMHYPNEKVPQKLPTQLI